jgi:hypothetical protein
MFLMQSDQVTEANRVASQSGCVRYCDKRDLPQWSRLAANGGKNVFVHRVHAIFIVPLILLLSSSLKPPRRLD